ncbi:alpha/beta-hydrolase family protein [Rhodococcus sp. IEGM 1408]|nr:alpha/beta-hydrolase family protein [Rhodococcus sp. IEGM 1408]MDV8000126.1 alpha/beta-hydrolase family protein [Rhodococcus sp. IEGM 1408]
MATSPSSDRIRGLARSLHPVGLAVALLFFTWSMTPSLLPRVWSLQAVATGISIATGYGLGCLLAWIVRRCGVSPDYSGRLRRIGWWTLAAVAAVAVPTFLILGSWWQQITRDLVGVERIDRANFLLILVLALAVAVLLLAAARGIRRGTAGLTRVATRYLPVPAARVVAVALVVLIAVLSINGVVYRGLIGAADQLASAADHGTADGVEQPVAPERSGSPASTQAWESLGKEGRTFVAGGPSAQQITEVTGRPAATPIRVYAGHHAAGSIEEAAELVVDELHRTGAFDRSVLAVATTTGRGWVNARVAAGLEYTAGGDSAIASMQYSFLPSPLAFLADRESPQVAGRALFEAVERVVGSRPERERPMLVTFGESLGSFGGQSAFSGAQDMVARTDGALWVGTPNFSPQWTYITDHRDAGSPERLPVIDGGERVRFAADGQDLALHHATDRDPAIDSARDPAPWGSPRVVYWQHASDPITWWSIDLLVKRPDWLREPLGPDLDPGVRWLPFVTFWQVTMDMVFSADVPEGHGHSFGPDAARMWAAILDPTGWTDQDTDRVYTAIAGGAV